jgi:flagellin-like hook-associated protein FlgL
MSISGVGIRSSQMVQTLIAMREQLTDLQRQLGTGKKSDTYAGLGLNRGLSVGLNAQLSLLQGYNDTIANVGLRLNVAQTALTQIDDVVHTVKSSTYQSKYQPDSTGQTVEQKNAAAQLDQILSLLNTRAGDRYLFSGLAVDRPSVETADHILNGDGARAGLKQVIAERKLADFGTGALGRLQISAPSTTSVAIEQDASPFGFKLASAGTTLTGATVAGPGGSPPSISIDLGATNPNAGESVQFSFTLPDGSSETLKLTATNSAAPGPGEFAIGVDTDATAANLQAALTAALGDLVAVKLPAASAMAAADNFFSIDDANPPQRVDGPPFDTATALIGGTGANTVSWYTGEAGNAPARSTASARVDQSITVNYGMRANEESIRWAVQNIATFAAVSLSSTDPNGSEQYSALQTRIGAALDGPPGLQKITDIESELAASQTSLQAAKGRHTQTNSTLSDLLQQIESSPPEEVAARMLALQTSLQASLQTTAILYQTNILKYL